MSHTVKVYFGNDDWREIEPEAWQMNERTGMYDPVFNIPGWEVHSVLGSGRGGLTYYAHRVPS